jgi:hypothetical protein
MTAGKLLRGLSDDPDARRRQLANLQHGRPAHGAYGGPRLETLRNEHDEQLALDFPHLDERRRAMLADRLARVALVIAWTNQHGVMPVVAAGKAKHGTTHPVIDKLDRWAAQADALIAQAEAERRTHTRADAHGSIADAEARIALPEPEPADAEVIEDAPARGEKGGKR